MQARFGRGNRALPALLRSPDAAAAARDRRVGERGTGLSQNPNTYLNGSSTGARYASWFDAYSASHYSTATSNFVSIDAAIDQNDGQVTINCGRSDSAYANQPYQIYVCNAF
ncbi:M35 family metallo-endopeptidase [Xanthomonas theicola]|uniref:M35 family metallo-endopeptidase n=1 Tax=Xanthomonas theicola TaxID=56464 RepID=UPI0020131830|nr:M35 family metallo-endopeptidase [Xanthomonas theicola]